MQNYKLGDVICLPTLTVQAGPRYFTHYGGMATNWHINGGLRYVPPVRGTIRFDTFFRHQLLFYLFFIFVNQKNRYLKERKQFGVPLAAFQLNQEKLVRMLGDIQSMLLVGWRLCKLYESGKMTPGHASLGKVCVCGLCSGRYARSLHHLSL